MVILLGNRKISVEDIRGESDDIQFSAYDYLTREELSDSEHSQIAEIYAAELYEEYVQFQVGRAEYLFERER